MYMPARTPSAATALPTVPGKFFSERNCFRFAEFDGMRSVRYSGSAGWSSLVARRAHNPKVVSSNLTPATIQFVNAQGVVHQGQPLLLWIWAHMGAKSHPTAPQIAHRPHSQHACRRPV